MLLLLPILPAAPAAAAPDPSVLEWSDPINLTAPIVGYPRVPPFPTVTGGNGPADVMWWAYNGTHRFLQFASIEGPQSPWQALPIVSCPETSSYNEVCAGRLISSAGGRTVVAYYPNASGALTILTRGSGESSFQEGAKLSIPYGQLYGLLVGLSDHVYLATTGWDRTRLFLSPSDDGGLTFGDPVDISLSGKGVAAPRVALAPDGKVGACWEDYRNSASTGADVFRRGGGYDSNPDIFASVLDADLTVVPRPVRVDDSILNNSHQIEPTCAFLPDGRMFVAWSDDRVAFNNDFDLYGALSNVNVSNFSRSVRLDDAPATEITIQAYPRAGADAEGNVYVAWSDNRDFHDAGYYARILTNGTEPQPRPNHSVPHSETGGDGRWPLFDSSLSISPEGAIYLSWLGPQNTAKLAIARAHAAGGGHAPSCSLSVPSSASQAAGAFNATGSVQDLDGISTLASAQLSLDGVPLAPVVILPYFWSSVEVGTLSPGLHELTGTVTDRTGASGLCSASFTVSGSPSPNRAPSVAVTSPAHDSSFMRNFTIEGTASDPDGDALAVTLSMDGGPWVGAAGNSSWSLAVDLSRLAFGAHTAAAVASDGSLFSAPALLRFNVTWPVPVAPPACEIVYPPDGATVGSDIEVIGRATDPDGLFDIARIEYRAFSSPPNHFAGQAPGVDPFIFYLRGLSGASNVQVNVTVFDREGRTGDCGAHYSIAQPAVALPTVSITAPANNSVQFSRFVVSGTASSSGAAIVRVNIVVIGEPLVVANGTAQWSLAVDTTHLSAGEHALLAYAVDSNGVSSAAARIAFFVGALDANGSLSPWLLLAEALAVVPSTPAARSPAEIMFTFSNRGNQSAENLRVTITVTLEGNSTAVTIYDSPATVAASSGPVVLKVSWVPPTPGRYTLRAVLNGDGAFPSTAILSPEATATVVVGGAISAPPAAADGAFLLVLVLVAAGAAAGLAGYLHRRRRRAA